MVEVSPNVIEDDDEEPKRIRLRRKIILIAEDEDGGHLAFGMSGIALDGPLTTPGGPLSDGWEALIQMHSKFMTERPLTDYEWSELPLRKDD